MLNDLGVLVKEVQEIVSDLEVTVSSYDSAMTGNWLLLDGQEYVLIGSECRYCINLMPLQEAVEFEVITEEQHERIVELLLKYVSTDPLTRSTCRK